MRTFSIVGAERRVGEVPRQVEARGAVVGAEHESAGGQRHQRHAAAQG